MNPRTKQLLLQVVPMAGEDGDLLPSLHSEQDIERFARIIREDERRNNPQFHTDFSLTHPSYVPIPDDHADNAPCSQHPDAPHGFNRDASHDAGHYVCDCASWEPPEDELKLLVRSLFEDYLDVQEESDSGNIFNPIYISCCRAMKLKPLGELINRLKELSK